jgi:hypothetical protein
VASYQKDPQRFFFGGIAAYPPDALPPSKFPYAKNIRTYAEGRVRPREGFTPRVSPGLGASINTLARLNDASSFNGSVSAVRVIVAGGSLYRGGPSDLTPALLDTGFSGDPLTTFSAQPPQSPRPYLYVGDTSQYRKFTTNGPALDVGLAQPSDPSTEPVVTVGAIETSANDIMSSTSWQAAGTVASAGTTFYRIDTTAAIIVYDNGVSGYCSIVPANFQNITEGTLVSVGDPSGSFDNAIITEVTIAIATTTVESILYDAGSSGLCTIQPAGSIGTGQLDAPPIDAYRRRAFEQSGTDYAVPRGTAGTPPAPDASKPVRRIRQVDFPVNSLIQLGSEVVRILSVAIGPDGIQSFRCSTAGTITAGTAISGYTAFRIFLPGGHAAGERVTRPAVQNILTYPAPIDSDTKSVMTGGIKGVWSTNLAQFASGQAVLPEDELHLAIRITRMTEIVSVRMYIDIDATTNDFLQNYYFYEWRASDIITAIQGTNAATVAPLIQARQTVVANQQLETGAEGAVRRTPTGTGTGTTTAQPASTTTSNAQRQRRPVALSATATQLGLGNNQWIDLRVKIGQLNRVGTDPSRSLANAKAFEVLAQAEGPLAGATPQPLTIQYSDLQIYGGSGPDVGEVGDPYVYAYRYRSSETGAVSNPSPPNRGGVIPRRQPVSLVPVASADPQVDKIDWFRLGGGLVKWTYVSTASNEAAAFVDTLLDSAIDGGETIRYDQYQPWAVQDLAHVGTCNVAGTAVEWVSGDTFDTLWSPGSVILVNGRATTLYASPASSTKLYLADSVGSGTGVAFSLPGPTLMSQYLPRVWGGLQGFFFACGDPLNPGSLYCSHGNNPEATSDAFVELTTTPSEPLQNGGIYNTFGFVFSTDQLYSILLQPGSPTPFRTVRTPCGKGLWSPWAMAVAPEGIYFLGPDGIYLTAGGSPAQSVSSPDLRAIFPHDGVDGQTTNGIPAPSMALGEHLRLAYIGGFLYFDYLDANGHAHTLIYDTQGQRWFLDDTTLADMVVRLEEQGSGVYNQIVGASNGQVYEYAASAFSDDGTAIGYELDTPWVDGDQPRLVKQFGDLALDADPGGGSGFAVTPVTEDGEIVLTPTTVGAAGTSRDAFIVNIEGSSGSLARNLGIRIVGSVTAADTERPTLYWWEPSFLLKADDTARRATDWETLGYTGAKFVQGVVIRANTYGLDKVVRVEKDGGATAITLTINHDGERQIAYPLAAAGWTPFVTELIRLVGADDVSWQLLDYRFVWEPAPELATQWETQFTSHDLPGYLTVHDMVVAHESTAPITLTLTVDDRTVVQTIPASGGGYVRSYIILCPNKGKAVKYQLKTDEPARLYVRDLAVRVQGWGLPGGYMLQRPFGGPSRAAGAEI